MILLFYQCFPDIDICICVCMYIYIICIYTTYTWSIHPSVNNYAKICNKHGDMYLFELVILFPSDKYPDVELLGHMVVLFLMYLRNLHPGFHSDYTNLLSHRQGTGIPFFPHPCWDLLFLLFWLIVILMSMKWCLIVAFICKFPDY